MAAVVSNLSYQLNLNTNNNNNGSSSTFKGPGSHGFPVTLNLERSVPLDTKLDDLRVRDRACHSKIFHTSTTITPITVLPVEGDDDLNSTGLPLNFSTPTPLHLPRKFLVLTGWAEQQLLMLKMDVFPTIHFVVTISRMKMAVKHLGIMFPTIFI
ncbi:hypothetical protein Sjap_008393 [Stephania japonica]|uniref:Uncharacterized protein n=1 Tax=Stephania japonica TaxID=461633 RepID=A0AAP0PCA3_9MAGN